MVALWILVAFFWSFFICWIFNLAHQANYRRKAREQALRVANYNYIWSFCCYHYYGKGLDKKMPRKFGAESLSNIKCLGAIIGYYMEKHNDKLR